MEFLFFTKNTSKTPLRDRSSVIAIKLKHSSTLHCVVSRHCNLSLCQHLCLNTIWVTHDLIRNGRTPTTPYHHTPDSCWLALSPPQHSIAETQPIYVILHYQGSRSEFDHSSFMQTLQEQSETDATLCCSHCKSKDSNTHDLFLTHR